jgi:hypothetical protein
MNILYPNFVTTGMEIFWAVVLPIIIIVATCIAVAGLVLTIGKWKIRMGVLSKLKSPVITKHRRALGPPKYKDRAFLKTG